MILIVEYIVDGIVGEAAAVVFDVAVFFYLSLLLSMVLFFKLLLVCLCAWNHCFLTSITDIFVVEVVFAVVFVDVVVVVVVVIVVMFSH